MLVAAFLLPLANIFISAGAYYALTRRFGPVTFREMLALMASANLLNFLPLRPGLVGRVAYHKAVNDIPIRHSTRVVIEAIVLGGLGAAILAGSVLADPFTGPPFALVVVFVFARASHSPLAWALAFKTLDAAAWTLRYWLALAIVGTPVSPLAASLIATGAQAATLIPLAGNGLGLREWAVGGMLSLRPQSSLSSADALRLGISADLINRAADVLVAIPTGLIASVWLARRLRMSPPPPPPPPPPPSPPTIPNSVGE